MEEIKKFKGRYYIDLENYVAFIANIEPNERLTNSVITETYGESIDGDAGDMNLMSKEIVETKGTGGGNEFFHDIRYKMVANLLDTLTKVYTSDNEFYFDEDDEDDTLSIGQKLAFNTLLKYNIIVKNNS